MSFPNVSETTMAVSKPGLLALFTNVGSSGSATWTVSKSGFSPNTELTDALSCSKVTTDANGGITATAVNGLPQVYVASTAVTSGSGLCGNARPKSSNTGTGDNSGAGAVSRSGLFSLALGAVLGAALV